MRRELSLCQAAWRQDSLSLLTAIQWIAGAERPDHLTINAPIDAEPGESLFEVWSIWFSPERDSLTLKKPPESIWSAMTWAASSPLIGVLQYCAPFAGQCSGAACAPLGILPCASYSFSTATMKSP